jgi:ketosteroid isomerase-like protein
MWKTSRLLMALALLAAGGSVRADPTDDRQQLSDLEQGCATALMKADLRWLDSFYDQDWLLVCSDGQRVSRKKSLAQLASGQVKWKSIVLSEVDVRVFGDTAIVIYKAAAVGEINGATIREAELCTDSFIRVDGGWRCVHSHNSWVP